jgi:hypothetical protein
MQVETDCPPVPHNDGSGDSLELTMCFGFFIVVARNVVPEGDL